MRVRFVGVAVALAALHCTANLQFPYTAETLLREFGILSTDLVFLLGLAVFGAALGRPQRFAHLAAILFVLSGLFHAAADYMTVYRPGQPFSLADIGLLGALDHNLLSSEPEAIRVLVRIGVCIALVAVYLTLAWCFTRVARAARGTGGAIAWAAALQGVVVLGCAWSSFAPHTRIWRESWLAPLCADVIDTVHPLIDSEMFDRPVRARIDAAAQRLAAVTSDLSGLVGADVHVVFVESYGRITMRHPELVARLEPVWNALEGELRAAGSEVVSSACHPAVRGGGSELAHAQLLAALPVHEPRTFARLLESSLVPLPKRFVANGYHAVEVMPTMGQHWPQGDRFYGFHEGITLLELRYDGTRGEFGGIPDQFTLHHLLERVVKPATKPLFTMFVSISSHSPFSSIPPYFEDWRIDAGTFQRPLAASYGVSNFDMATNPETTKAYGHSIEYTLRAVAGFAARVPRPSLLIVLGDHQPPIATSRQPPDRSYDVPIHVISNRPGLLAPWQREGFTKGFVVPPATVAFDTADFAPMLLRLYASPPQAK